MQAEDHNLDVMAGDPLSCICCCCSVLLLLLSLLAADGTLFSGSGSILVAPEAALMPLEAPSSGFSLPAWNSCARTVLCMRSNSCFLT